MWKYCKPGRTFKNKVFDVAAADIAACEVWRGTTEVHDEEEVHAQ